ncbi:MAG: Lpg1974 family pore-forming outer membrane protein [Rhabdochlamydiaceae bacterium]
MKQLSLGTIPLLCAAIAPLYAASPPPDPARQFEQRWNDNQITPMTNPKPHGSFNPFFTGDYIYWKAYEKGLNFVWNGTPDAPTPVPPNATHGKVFHPRFQWASGFKVGLGNKFSHDGWDLYAQYTQLLPKAGEEEEMECCETELTSPPKWSNYWLDTNAGPESVLIDEAAHWHLRFNVLDLELGRDYYFSRFLTLRPFAGMKFAWTRERYKVKFHNVMTVGDEGDTAEDSTDVIPLGSNIKLKFTQREFGVGIRAGLDANWYFYNWIGIYGDFAMTGLWNRFKEKRQDEINTPEGTEYLSTRIKDKVYDVTAVFEIGLGLFFEWTFGRTYVLEIAAGWENQIWFNQNNFIYLMNTNAPGNLSLEGFTLSAGLAF